MVFIQIIMEIRDLNWNNLLFGTIYNHGVDFFILIFVQCIVGVRIKLTKYEALQAVVWLYR